MLMYPLFTSNSTFFSDIFLIFFYCGNQNKIPVIATFFQKIAVFSALKHDIKGPYLKNKLFLSTLSLKICGRVKNIPEQSGPIRDPVAAEIEQIMQDHKAE